MAMSKDQRRQIISKALEVVKRACGGEVKGYAEGGSPKSVLSEATRSPVPDWLLDQQRSVRDGMPMPEGVERRFPSAPFETIGGAAELGAELTGIPSMVRGYGRLTGDGDGWSKARGAGEMAIGALPGVSATARGAAAIAPMFSSAGRSATTMGGLAVPGMADMIANPASAQTVEKLTADQIRALQEKLKALGYYKGKIDGAMGDGTARAAEAYRMDQEKAAAAKAEESRHAAQIEASQSESKKADAALAETQRIKEADTLKDTRRKEGEEKLRGIEANVPWYRQMLRDYGPAAGYGAGMVLGGASAHKVGKLFDKTAASKTTRADDLIGDGFASLQPSEKAARLNQFWVEGQRRPSWGARETPYSSNEAGVLSANAKAPSAGELYLTPKISELRAHTTPMLGYGAEAVYGNHLKSTSAEERKAAEKALAEDPSDVNIAAYQRAKDREAMGDFIGNMGRFGAFTHAGVALGQSRFRERPDIAKAEAAKFDLDSALAQKGASSTAGARSNPPGSTGSPGTSLVPGTAGGTGTGPPGTQSPQGSTGPNISGGKSASEASDFPLMPGTARDKNGLVYNVHTGHKVSKKLYTPRDDAGSKPKNSAKPASKSKDNEQGTDKDIPERKFGGPVVEMARRYANGGVAGLMRYADGGMPELGAMPPPGPVDEPEGPLIPHGPVHGPDGGRADTRPVSVPDGSFVVPADCVAALGEGNTQAGFAQLDDMFGTAETMHMASGGVPERAVPIMISDGEYVISPTKVAEIGNGNLDVGHKALDKFIVQLRQQNIKKLQSLPGPAKN